MGRLSIPPIRRISFPFPTDVGCNNGLVLKHSFGNAQNLKLVTTLREENECLKKTIFELNEEKTVFENKFVSFQSRVMNLSKQVSRVFP